MAKRTITSKSTINTTPATAELPKDAPEVIPTASQKSQVPIQGQLVSQPAIVEEQEEPKEFEITQDEEAGIVSFELVDGTPVVLRSPKPKDFLLMNSFVKLADDEYKTEEMLGFKLITLCMTKYGSKNKVDFYEFLDSVEDIEDLQRTATAFSFFRSNLERLQAKLKK
ncbi:hypothetical protein H6F88_31705 [Oculatella sp. FACHB-28]|uniref:hypothetical protein n=1 Tax=Oculatella sp. FACHB-28 TaxID=2692845 RepID=UPI0016842460|nr:hypothetical protein [Oculatella sp. FACHB-28]MBD2060509.1 hypothetical protein [Oculatella sp. FACHB-28]